MCPVVGRVVGMVADPQVVVGQGVIRQMQRGAEQAIPQAEEQREVHIAVGPVLQVMQAMHRRPGEHMAQRAEAHVDIAVLQQQLDGNAERQQCRHLLRQPAQQQRQGSAQGFEQLVQRVLHQAIETIQPGDAVMHRMQPPQRRATVAGVVHQGDAEVSDGQRQQQLRSDRPVTGPDADIGQDQGDQRNGRHAQHIEAFVDAGMNGVAAAVVLRRVPVQAVRAQALAHGAHAYRCEQQQQQPTGARAARDEQHPGTDETEEEHWTVQAAHLAAP